MTINEDQRPHEHPDFWWPDCHDRGCPVLTEGFDDGGPDCECFYGFKDN